MAVELRCPDCRAKLRLPDAPEAGTEVECPKCGTVFPAPEPEPADGDDAPKKKKKPARDPDDGSDEKPKKTEDADAEKKPKAKPRAKDGAPRKRKAKKNETSNTLLIGVVAAGLLLLVGVTVAMIWFLNRTSKSVEMMYYLPEGCDSVSGLNLGHAQKYPDFYKRIASSFGNTEFKAAGDAFAKVLGAEDGDKLMDYVVCGSSGSGSATVIRTKTEIDGAALAKLPGAQAKSLNNKTYYVADALKSGGPQVRVFSPTNRLIVFCPIDVPEEVFKKMINGHAGGTDKTVGGRMGELGKRVTRGTFWRFELYGVVDKPLVVPPPPGGAGGMGSDSTAAQFERVRAETLAGSKGTGMKASIGSREVRFEIVVWYSDSDKSSSTSKKWKESDLGKGDEGTPPRWWTERTDGLGSKKISAQMLANVGCGSSGELFYVQSAVETIDLKETVGSLISKVTPTSNAPGGPGGPPPGPPGGAPPGGPGGPPKMPRRRHWARR